MRRRPLPRPPGWPHRRAGAGLLRQGARRRLSRDAAAELPEARPGAGEGTGRAAVRARRGLRRDRPACRSVVVPVAARAAAAVLGGAGVGSRVGGRRPRPAGRDLVDGARARRASGAIGWSVARGGGATRKPDLGLRLSRGDQPDAVHGVELRGELLGGSGLVRAAAWSRVSRPFTSTRRTRSSTASGGPSGRGFNARPPRSGDPDRPAPLVSAVRDLHAARAAALPLGRDVTTIRSFRSWRFWRSGAGTSAARHRQPDQVRPDRPARRARSPALLRSGSLWRKGVVYSRTTTLIFRLAPVVLLATTLVAAALLPLDGQALAARAFPATWSRSPACSRWAGSLLVLAAMDTGSSFEGMGASREVTIATFAEPALFLCFTVLVLATGELSADRHAGRARCAAAWPTAGSLAGAGRSGLFIVTLAETCRVPVDDPADPPRAHHDPRGHGARSQRSRPGADPLCAARSSWRCSARWSSACWCRGQTCSPAWRSRALLARAGAGRGRDRGRRVGDGPAPDEPGAPAPGRRPSALAAFGLILLLR